MGPVEPVNSINKGEYGAIQTSTAADNCLSLSINIIIICGIYIAICMYLYKSWHMQTNKFNYIHMFESYI